MTTPDLLPCPFCGGEAELFTPNWTDSYRSAAGCTKCGARTDSYLKDAEVITLWNTRAAPRWIPVTERLPEFQDETKLDRSVLCTMEIKGKRHVTEIYFTHDNSFEYGRHEFTAPNWSDRDCRLIAWQYILLPEPPKEVE